MGAGGTGVTGWSWTGVGHSSLKDVLPMREPWRGWISQRGRTAGALEAKVLPDRTLQGTQDKVLSSLSVENTASEEWLCCA